MKHTACYHLPGLFEFYELYRLFLPLFREHREYFYDWCEIGSIYGAPPDCIWGGGRVGSGDRDPREVCFQFNKRILGYFCVDLTEVWMATRLAGKDTRFLPFNQGSNGAGRDGGAGNPPNPNGYLTAYLWEEVFQKDSMMDILQKFLSLQDGKTLIFPRYHQLDVVRKLVADVRQKGAGQHYLIQHSAEAE